ncbi:M48 family metallopeptidase [Desulfocurvibacter africanus]|uniref:M48 family metallopeptidase n=1 Tax=Desulfocurvibacter africanus TaxID=873 RepID=UPI002FDA4AFF
MARYAMDMNPSFAFPRTLVMILALATTLAAILAACAEAPYTGRQQLMLVGDDQASEMGNQAAQEVLTKEPVVTGTPQAQMVQRVGQRIAAVTESQYKWQFHLVGKDVPNAFALPGGHVFVYEGLFKYARTEPQLAAVIGHEIAHVLARHGSERMSVAAATQLGTGIAGSTLGLSPTVMEAFGIAANYGVVMPYSRTQESESDRIGIILMAKAGYPPEASIELWQNMMQAPGDKPPAFLSTHPSDQQRIANIRKHLAEAQKYYQPAR